MPMDGQVGSQRSSRRWIRALQSSSCEHITSARCFSPCKQLRDWTEPSSKSLRYFGLEYHTQRRIIEQLFQQKGVVISLQLVSSMPSRVVTRILIKERDDVLRPILAKIPFQI